MTLIGSVYGKLDNKCRDEIYKKINNMNLKQSKGKKQGGIFIDLKENLLSINIIFKHLENRFNYLDNILKNKTKFIVRFPTKVGNLSTKDKIQGEQGLGTRYFDYMLSKRYTHIFLIQDIKEYIKKSVDDLKTKYNNQVIFGRIGDYYIISENKFNISDRSENKLDVSPGIQQDGKFIIDVWEADINKYNLDNKEPIDNKLYYEQRPGIFGIITSLKPTDIDEDKYKKILLEDDKLMGKLSENQFNMYDKTFNYNDKLLLRVRGTARIKKEAAAAAAKGKGKGKGKGKWSKGKGKWSKGKGK